MPVVVLIAFLLALVWAAPAAGAIPTVTGPISGGERGRPFTSATVDLASEGYVEEEYFLEGLATTYATAPGSVLGADGEWDIAPAGNASFKTRILVRRPARSHRFNGTVVVEWLNVTGGWDIDAVWAQIRSEILRSGYAWVGVSAQRASVNGPPVLAGVSLPLVEWDPERYGTLSIIDDGSSYDIFTQAAAVVGPDRPRRAPDPMGGLRVRRILATGASQSAHRLASYVNGVQPLDGAYEGFLIVGRFGAGASLAPGVDVPRPLRLRTDLASPVLTVNTESEALAHFGARQPDTDRLRYWEVAGAAHQDEYVDQLIDAQIRRDLGFALPACDQATNQMPVRYVLNAALDHLDEWARSAPPSRLATRNGGTGLARPIIGRSRGAPPRFDPIAISGDPLEIERDELGNARGGIRLPQLEVPTAQYGPVGSPEALRCDLRGFTLPFPEGILNLLYSSHQSYVRQVSSAVFRALRAGYLLPPDARETKRAAEDAAVP